MPNSPYYL